MSFVGDILGSVIGADASRRAANIGADATRYGVDATQRMFDRSVELQEPWRQAGIGALGQLTAGTGAGGDFNRSFTMADFQADPGMAFRMQQGQRALESSAAARGGLLSGGTGKNLVEYGQNFGSQEYGNAYNRFNADMDRRFNRLSSIAGLGQTATRDVTNQGTQVAGSISDLYTQGANARAGGVIGQANAISRGIGGVANYFGQQRAPNQYWGVGGGDGSLGGYIPSWGDGP